MYFSQDAKDYFISVDSVQPKHKIHNNYMHFHQNPETKGRMGGFLYWKMSLNLWIEGPFLNEKTNASYNTIFAVTYPIGNILYSFYQ